MIAFLFALLLILIGLAAIVLQKTYSLLPPKELKRRARHGDELARLLYRAATYGTSLQALLWTIVAAAFAASFLLLSVSAPWPLAFIAEVVVIVYGFVWLPTGHVTQFGVRLAAWATPVVAPILHAAHPLLAPLVAFARAHRVAVVRTGLYEREDLLDLLEKQKDLPDNRFSPEELELLKSALTFSHKLVRDVCVPRREVRTVSADEAITPVLIQELHDSGYARFPVFLDAENPEKFVGTLYLQDLVNLKATGHVRDVMHRNVYYIHEEYSLEQVLDAFRKTKHHLFIVVNRFEEWVGVVAIEDILEQILGFKIVDEFDCYDDLRAVAADHARHDHKLHKKEHEEPAAEPSPEPQEKDGETPTEMVE